MHINIFHSNLLSVIRKSAKFAYTMFVLSQLLNESSQKVPVGLVLQQIQKSCKPEQPGFSSSIRLDFVCIRTFVSFFFFATVSKRIEEEEIHEKKSRLSLRADVLMGCSWPPLLLISHLHLHVICPGSRVTGIHKYLSKTPWFVHPDWIRSRLEIIEK